MDTHLPLAVLLLLVVVVLFVSEGAEAIDPEWSYTTASTVQSVAISADGEYIVAACYDGKAYLFDRDSNTPLWNYTTGEEVWAVAISADGEYVVVGSDKIYFFGKDNSTPLWSYDTGDYVASVSISANGEYIAAGSNDDKVYLFDKESGTPVWSRSTYGNVLAVAISADGEYIVAGSSNNRVNLFDRDNSTPLWTYATNDNVRGVAISADGEYIAASSWGDEVYLFNKENSTPLWSYDTGDYLDSVAISADGEYITAGSWNGKVYLFNKESNDPLWSYTTGGNSFSVAISADGEHIVAGSYDYKVYLFDKDSSTPLWSYETGNSIQSVAISADGEYIAAGSRDDKVYAFRNDPVERPSVIPYGPRNGSGVLSNATLRWFPGSDDIANLTFDVYLSWIKTDVEDNNSAARVADDISNYTLSVGDLTEDETYYWKVVATDPTGSATSRIMEFYGLDTTAPITNITSGPPDPTGYRNATFTFSADENDVTFECKLDSGSWSNCTSPATYYNLSRGDYHLFQVKATDDSGNEGEEDDWMWEILENEKPTASIDSISPQIAERDEEEVSFSGSGEDEDGTIAAYQWISSIDGTLSTSANFTVTDLSFGNHTITFMVKDNEGDWSDEVTSWVDVRKMPEWSYDTGDDVYQVAISADGEYIVAGSWGDEVYLFNKENSTPLRSYDTGDYLDSVAISADGEYIAVGSYDEWVYLFEKDSSTPLWSYSPGSAVGSVAISADGEYIAAGSFDDKVYLFNKDSNTPLWSHTTGDDVLTVAISADGEYIVAGSDKVYLFDRDSSTPLWNYTTGNTVLSVAISADGEYIAASSSENVYLFDKDNSTPLWSYLIETDSTSISFSADGEYIAFGTWAGKVYLFDKDTNDPLWSYVTETEARVLSVAISADGEYIAAGSFDDKVYLFDKDSSYGDVTPIWSYTTGGSVDSVAISADGEYIVAGSLDDKVYLFENTASGNESGNDPPTVWNVIIEPNPAYYGQQVNFSAEWEDTDGYVVAFEWRSDIDGLLSTTDSFDSNLLSVGKNTISFRVQDDDGAWSSWALIGLDILEQEEESELPWSYTTGGWMESVAVSADGEYIAAGSYDDNVYLFDKDSSTPLWSYTTGNDVLSVAISPDGEYIAAGSRDNKVYLFHKDSSTPHWSYTTESDVLSVAISKDGEYITAGSWNGKVYLFNKESNDPLWNYTTGDIVLSVAISADGEYIAAGSRDYKVYLFDKDSSTPLWSYLNPAGDSGVNSVAISADGNYVVAGSDNSNVYLFDKVSSTPLWSHPTDDVVFSVAISADGEYIAAGSNDAKVYLFDKDSSIPLWSYGAGSAVLSVAVSADGGYIIASSSEDVYLFDKNSSTPLWNYAAGSGAHSVAISADGEYIAVGSYDSKLYAFKNTVSGNDPPAVWNLDVGPNPVYENELVSFSAEWNDTDGYVIAFEWRSDIDGLLSTTDSFDSNLLSVGDHTITFRVQDDDGAWSEKATVDLVIEREPAQQVDITPGTPVTLDTWEDLGLLLELVVGDIASGNVTVTSVDVTPPLPDNGALKDIGIYVSISIDMTIQNSLDYANVTLNFDINILPDSVSADTLRVYHYSEEGGWEASETGAVDLENGTVWGHFSNFSIFAVFGSNMAPVADAGPDLKISPGSQAVFFGTATDHDGTVVLYEWDFDGDGTFDYSASDGIASHVYDDNGFYLVILRVTDNEGATGFDETVVTVGESSSLAFFDSPLFRIFFPTVILLLAVGYYAYRKYRSFGIGALDYDDKFALKKDEDVTVVCPACGINMKVPRLGTLQMVVCENCGAEGKMEV